MLKNMSIKKKLLSAFIIIAVLVIISSSFGYFGASKSSEGFTSYREMAKDSLLASRVQANMLMVRMNVKDYLNNPVQKEIDEFNHYYNKTNGFIEKALKEIQKPSRAKYVKTISKDIKIYKESFLEVVNYMNIRNEVVNKIFHVNGKKIEQLLTSVMRTAKKDGDIDSSLETAEAIRVLLLARLYNEKFLKSNNKDDSTRVHKEFQELENELKAIENHINNSKLFEMLEEAIHLSEEYEKGVDQIVEIIEKRNHIINNKLNKLGPEIAKLAEDVKLSIKKDQDRIGPEVSKLNDEIKAETLLVALIVIGLVIFFAISITLLISKGLNGLNNGILNLLNSKDVSSRVDVLSNNEIGNISMNFNKYLESIENGLNEDAKVIDDVKRVVSLVKDGKIKQEVTVSSSNKNLNDLRKLFNEMLLEMSANISEDIQKVEDALEKYSKLDFTHRIENSSGKVEKGLNHLAEIINKMLVDNKTTGLTLQNSANTLLDRKSVV